jgi:uncharacterized protein YvpB
MNNLFSFEAYFIFLAVLLIMGLVGTVISGYRLFRKDWQLDRSSLFSRDLLQRSDIKELVFLGGSILSFLLAVAGGYFLFSAVPNGQQSYPPPAGHLSGYDQPIEITFNLPVWKDKIQPNINPETLGTWDTSYLADWFPWTRRIRFYPDQSFPPNQKVMIYLSYLANDFHSESGNEYLVEFYTPPLPKVIAVEPPSYTENVLIDQPIVITLDQDTLPTSEWSITSEPAQEFNLAIEDKVITATPKTSLQQGTSYTVTLRQTPVTYNLKDESVISRGESEVAMEVRFTTVKSPELMSYQPTGENVMANAPVTIQFDTPVVLAEGSEYLGIEPPVEGAISWDEAKTLLTYMPAPSWQKDTMYKVTLKKGLKNVEGGAIKNDFSYQFKTIGPVRVTGFIPSNGSGSVPISTSVAVTFDQLVSHSSAESKFRIAPTVNGSFSWSDNKLSFTPAQALEHGTRYTVTMAAGVESIDGLPSNVDYPSGFTTINSQINLGVPYYEQPDGYSCNTTAVRMALAYRGVYLSQSDVLSAIGTSGTRGSGNPYNGFVENYGAYWQPFESLVGSHRNYQVFTNWNLTDLLKEVEKGNPVVVWGQNGWSTPTDISWTASDGTHVYAISGMHSYVVKGFTGSSSNPGAILINDPWRGVISMSPSVFNQRWSYFKTAMVIY